MPPGFDFRKHQRELVLGGVLVTVLYMRAGSAEGGVAADPSIFATDPPPAVAQAIGKLGSVKIPNVLLDRLQEAKAPYDPSQRNIFRYGNIPPPPPSPEEV